MSKDINKNEENRRDRDFSIYWVLFQIFVSVMQENPDLWKWLTGQEQPPELIKTNPVRYDPKDELLISLLLFFPASILTQNLLL